MGIFLVIVALPASVTCLPGPEAAVTEIPIRVSATCSVSALTANSPERLNEETFPDKYKYSIVENYGPNQIQLVKEALGAVPDVICKAVKRIAFVTKEYETDEGVVKPDVLGFVDDRIPDLMIVIAPEIPGQKEYYPTENNLQLGDGLFREYELDENGNSTGVLLPAEESLQKKLIVWKRSMKSIMHEGYHNATHLLESVKTIEPDENHCSEYYRSVRDSDHYQENQWGSGVKENGKNLVKNLGLEEGFKIEWCRLHNNFVKANLSEHYNPDLPEKKATNPGGLGFLSEYSQKSPSEDIAEVGAWIQLNDFESRRDLTVGDLPHLNITDAQKQRFANVKLYYDYYNFCKSRQDRIQQFGLPPNLAAIFTKINFLRDLGFISEQAYESCLNGGKIGLTRDLRISNGFHRLEYESGEWMYRHDIDKLGHTIVDPFATERNSTWDQKLFIIIGKGILNDDGKQYNMEMQLRFNKTNGTNLPRGIYKLDWDWESLLPGVTRRPCPPIFSSSESEWTFFVNVEKAPSKSFCTVVGQILVLRSSKDFIEATMIINKVLKRVGGPPVQLPSLRIEGGIAGLAAGTVVPEVPNFRVYIRWKRD